MKFVVPLIVLCYIASIQTQVSPSCKGCMGLMHFNDETEPKTNPMETSTDPSETATEEEKQTVLIEAETGIYEIDFNDENSLDEFEPCYFQGPSNLFKIKSYADVSVERYRNDSENHLGNTGAGFSCIKTKKSFDLNTNTKIEFAIFLNSNSEDDSYLEFQAYQEEEGTFTIYQLWSYGFEWHVINQSFFSSLTNAKIQILARMSTDATLAIEYLHVIEGITDPTEETTHPTEETTDPTEETTDTTEETTDPTGETTDPTEETTVPTEETTVPTEETTDPTEETTDPTEETTDPTDETADPTDETTDPTEETTDPTEETTDPTEETTDPTEETADPTEETTDPTEETVPTEEITDPTEESSPTEETEPTETDPTVTNPTEEITDSTETDTTEPTDQTETDPTERTDQTEKSDPTDEATNPAEEETDTTEPKICEYEIDFNDLASLDEFEPCDYPPEYGLHLFGIKSYADVPLEPYRSDVDNYLSNLGVGYSCIRTTQSFNFETNVELHSAIYLNASRNDLVSSVLIQAALPGGSEQTFASVRDRWSNNWNVINERISEISISDARIQIRATTHSDDVLIAIEYIRIVYPCTPTSTTTIDNPTGNETDPPTDTTTRPTRIPPYPQNSNIIWIILSFSFFLTTIVVSVALFCLVYMYKAAVVRRKDPSTISIKQATALPRLAVANRSDGDSVIVGIGNDVTNKPKYF